MNNAHTSSLARRLALLLAVSLAWSFVLAGAARAVTYHPPTPPGHARTLSPAEMKAIVGAQGGGAVIAQAYAIDPNAGGTYPWEQSVGGVNTGNGNKLTSLPLVSWTARGGMAVAFVLNHNSQSSKNGELGQKWTSSYNVYLSAYEDEWTGTRGMAIHWGDDLTYGFVQNVDGSFSAPNGLHDTLVQNGTTSYDLTTKEQVKYHFTNPNGTAWTCASITDENGNLVTINHSASDRVSSIVDPTGRTLTLGYDASNRISTLTDPQSRTWTLTYNASNDLTQVSLPPVNGQTFIIAFGYNGAHDIVSLTDARGSTSTFGYGSRDGLTFQQDALGNQTTFASASSGMTVTDPNGHQSVYTYTSGKVSRATDAAGFHEDYLYDAANNRTQVTDKRGLVWQSTYDGAGNRLTAKDPYLKVTTWTYNSKNKPLTVTKPLGENVAYTYDSNDNLTKMEEKNSSGTVKATTNYTIGSYGLVSAKQDPNSHSTTYGYSTNGDLTSVTTPLGKVTTWGVNGLGVRTSRTDALLRVTTYTLDNWERVRAIAYTGRSGDNKTFTYDANSNVTAFTDVTGTTSCTFDNDNRLINESKGGSTVVSHTYDGTGQKGLLSTTTDANSRPLTYAYTNRNQLYSVAETAGTTTYGYDAAGDETGITNANGTTVTKVYDNANRLSSVTNKNSGGTTLSSFAYVYNDDSQRTSCTEASGDVVSYGYDAQGHLTSESRTGTNAYTITYVVDGAGNRTSQTQGGVTTSFTLDNDDELTATSGGFTNSYGYNANGEQTSRTLSGTAYMLSYDYEGQLTSTGGATFTYDAAGRRISRTASSTTTNFLYDGGKVLLEKQGSTTSATYSYGNALVRKDGETPLFDGLGSERTVTNSSQAVTGTLTLSAFGQTVASTGISTNPYMFAATSRYRNDGDAGLTHVGARYYDAQVGRFITRDTVLREHPYVYCDGDPVNATDPSGHSGQWFDDIKTGIEAILLALAGVGVIAALPVEVGPIVGVITTIVGGIAVVVTAIYGVGKVLQGVGEGFVNLGNWLGDTFLGTPEGDYHDGWHL